MKLILFFAALLFPIFLSAQDLAYTVNVLDERKEPQSVKGFLGAYPTSAGAFIVESEFREDYVISFFRGTFLLEVFSSPEKPVVHGATDDGLFISIPHPTLNFRYDIYFVSRTGRVTKANNAPAHGTKTYIFRNELYLFSSIDGVFKFTEGGQETRLTTEFSGCFCNEPIYEFNDKLVYETDHSFFITDGTRTGTDLLFSSTSGTLLQFNDRLFHSGPFFGLEVFDPVTGEVTDLTTDLPHIPGGLGQVDVAAATNTGVTFVSNSPATGRELFITDGTREGTTLLMDLAPGAEDGISGYDFVGTPENIAGQMVFGRLPGNETQEVWMTNGTADGTRRVFDIANSEQFDNSIVKGAEDSAGNIFLSVKIKNGISSLERLLVISDLTSLTTSLTDIGASTFDGEIIMINDRVVVKETVPDTDGAVIYKSYSANPGETRMMASFSDSPTHAFVLPGALFLTIDADDEGTLDLFATQGGENDLILFRKLNSHINEAYKGLFIVGGQPYFYLFDKQLGETIYKVNLPDYSPDLIIDLYENTKGRGPERIFKAGDKLLLYFDDFSGNETYLFGGTSGSNIEVSRSGSFFVGREPMARIGDRLFYEGSSTEISEIDIISGVTRALTVTPPANSASGGRWIALNEKLYKIFTKRNFDQNTEQFYLVEYDLLAESLSIVHSDTFPDNISTSRGTATDGEVIYFTRHYANGASPAIYDPSTGQVTALSTPLRNEEFRYRRIGDSVAVEFDSFFNNGPSYWLTGEGLGGEIDLGVGSGVTVDFGAKILFIDYERNELFATEKATGESVLLSYEADWLTDLGNGQAIYFARSFSTGDWSLWETDGTEAGTEMMFTLETSRFNGPPKVEKWGDIVAIISDWGKLQLYDPATNRLETVGVQLPSLFPDLVTLGNRLYFVANHPTFGEELHYLKLAGSDIIAGEVFRDENGNGIRDANEIGLPNVRIEVAGGNITSLFTQPDGRFTLGALEEEAYTFTLPDLTCFQAASTPAQYHFTYSSNNLYELPFGVQPKDGEPELRVLLNSGTIRCGFEHNFWLTITNTGCSPLAGESLVLLPPEMAFLEADVPPSDTSSSHIRFTFDTLQPGEQQQFQLLLRMPDEFFAGLPINVGAAAGAYNVEGAMAADTFTYHEILRCAIDPNDKKVAPSREEPSNSNYTQIDEKLHYTIRFQNTGNDTAFTVRIQDKISESLNLTTIKPLSSSHPFTASVQDDRTVVFLFENILLPDSTTNPIGSQGYITFEIEAYSDLEDFATVDNSAGIYFDFNRPIITNTVTSTFVEFLDEDQDGFLFYEDCDDINPDINPDALEIFGNDIDENCDDVTVSTQQPLPGSFQLAPNPTTGQLTLTYSEDTQLTASLFNAAGTKLLRFFFRGNKHLDLSSLPAGLYFVHLYQPQSGQGVTFKVAKQ